LVFHHKDPLKKSFEISNAASRSVSAIREELLKCILLCNRCHSELHAGLHHISDYEHKDLNLGFNPPDFRKATYAPTEVVKGRRKKFEIPKEELESLIKNYPITSIAQQFGVSDSAIRKRALSLGIILPSRRGFWSKHTGS